MTLVVNNPANDNSAVGTILAIVTVIAAVAIFLIYGLPRLRGRTTNPAPSANINVQLPSMPTNNQPSGGNNGSGY